MLISRLPELDEIVSVQCQEHEFIDNALRSYLAFTTNYKGGRWNDQCNLPGEEAADFDAFAGEYLQTDYDVARCSHRLLHSILFASHRDYVRRQIVYSFLQVGLCDSNHECNVH